MLVGSRFTHPKESRYAPIEGEALAVADALDKARHFVLGCNNLVIAVDHKPLRRYLEIDLWIKLVILDYAILKKSLLVIISEWCTYPELRTELPMPSPGTLFVI